MYQRANGTWCDTLPQGKGKPPKFFYGKTKADVKRKMAEWTAEQERGILFRDAVEEWYDQLGGVKYNTVQTYKRPAKDVKERFGDMPLKDIEPADINTYLYDLKKKGWKYAYINMRLTVLSCVYKYFISKEKSVLKFNPCAFVDLPKGVKQKPRQLASEEAIKIIKNNVGHEFGLFPFLIMYTGLRRNEALALTDESFVNGHIKVRRSILWVGGKVSTEYDDTPKSASSIRDVIVLKPLEDALPKGWKGYLFSRDGGKSPLTRSDFVSLWNKYLRDVGLAVVDGYYVTTDGYKCKRWKNLIVPHQLRHEFATICMDAELSTKDASELLGHSSERVTSEIYQHIRDSRRKESENKLQQYVQSY